MLAVSIAGCHTDMWRQPKTQPLDFSDFYPDNQVSRPLIPGTIARDHLRLDEGYYTGAANGKWLDTIPHTVNKEFIKRGQDRFNIYCTPCHGRLGDGQGMIATRGFTLRRPVASYHTDRLRKMPVGYFYDVITNGYGAMYSYASRVEPEDRWAIVSYIRALQLSQHAMPTDADPNDLAKSDQTTPTATASDTPSEMGGTPQP
jgi:mono/diheme cytochrome c family protein